MTSTGPSSSSTHRPPDSSPLSTPSPSTTAPSVAEGHEGDIASAKRTIETLPDQIRDQAANVETLTTKLGGLDKRWRRAERMNERRPALETQHGDINARLDDDRRIRTRQIRHNPPDRITNTLGNRPTRRRTITSLGPRRRRPRPTPDRLRPHRRHRSCEGTQAPHRLHLQPSPHPPRPGRPGADHRPPTAADAPAGGPGAAHRDVRRPGPARGGAQTSLSDCDGVKGRLRDSAPLRVLASTLRALP